MQNIRQGITAGLGIQLLFVILFGVLAWMYWRADERQRLHFLSQILGGGMIAVVILNVVMLGGILFTMQQMHLAQSGLFMTNLIVMVMIGGLELALLLGFGFSFRRLLRSLEQGKAAKSTILRDCHRGIRLLACFCAVKLIEPLIQAVVINSQTMSEVDALSFSSVHIQFEFPSLPLVVWGLLLVMALILECLLKRQDAQSAAELTEEEGEPSGKD